MFKPEFVDFLKTEGVYRYSAKLKKEDCTVFFEKRKLDKDINLIYYFFDFSADSLNASIQLRPCLLSDNTGRILYFTDFYGTRSLFESLLLPGNQLEQINFNSFFKEAEANTFADFMARKDEFISEEAIEKSDSNAALAIVHNAPVSFNIGAYGLYTSHNGIGFDFVRKYYFDRENLMKELVELCTSTYKSEFKRYINLKIACDRLKKEIETNDNFKAKNKAVEILNGKYKTFTVNFKCPNGDVLSKTFKKDKMTIEKEAVFTENEFCGIPFFAIQSITWSRSTLYKAADYNISYSDKDLEQDFFNAKMYNHFPKEYYNDKEFVEKLLNISHGNVAVIGDKLLDDKEYIIHLLGSISPHYYEILFKRLPYSLVTDIDFIKKIIVQDLDNADRTGEYSMAKSGRLLSDLNPILFQDFDFVKFLFENDLDPDYFIKHIPPEFFIENPDIVKVRFDFPIEDEVIAKYNFNLLEKLYTKDRIAKVFHKISYEDFDNETIFKYVFSDEFSDRFIYTKSDKRDVESGLPTSVIDHFRDDEFLIYRLSKKIDSTHDAKYFLDELGIDVKDYDKILPFCSFNPFFVPLLDEENMQVFLSSCLSGIDNISIKPNKNLELYDDYIFAETDYAYFGIPKHLIYKNIIFIQKIDEDVKDVKFSKIDNKYRDLVVDNLMEELKKRYPDFKTETKIEDDLMVDTYEFLLQKETEQRKDLGEER